jgi:hypothetical protein
MSFSTRILDQRAKRESARRQRAQDRRAADQEEAAREELRRQEARKEAQAFAAELDAKEDKKRRILNDLRIKMRTEKQEKARIAKRIAIEDLIAQIARRKQQSREALQQQKESRQEREAHRKEASNRALQGAAQKRRDERKLQDTRRDAIDTVRARRAQDELNEDRAAARAEQTAMRDDERRRQEDARAKKIATRDEAAQRQKAEQQERETEEQKRQQARLDRAKEQRLEEKERQRAVEDRRQRQAEGSQERKEQERRQEHLLAAREQQQLDRREREDQEAQRRESLASLRAKAAKAGQEARSAAIEDSSDIPQKPDRPILVDPRAQSVLSGSLPWLKVVGNTLVTLAGDHVVLRGVTLQGWDNTGSDIERCIAAIAGWGATIVRIPLCQSTVTQDNGSCLQMLDRIITAAAGSGCYTDLALCRMDTTSVFGSTPQGEPNYWPPMPGADSIGMWRLLAQRYQNEPGVVFELFTAPHPASNDDVSGVEYQIDRYTTWCQMTIAELRSHATAMVCLVAAADYGIDTSILPITGTDNAPIPGVVYTVHAAPSRPLNWTAVRSLAQKRPIMVSEWTGTENDLFWAHRIAAELRGLGIGFCGGGAFVPPVYFQKGPGYAPTRMGMIIQRELARPEEAAMPLVSTVPDSFLIPSFSDEGGIP